MIGETIIFLALLYATWTDLTKREIPLISVLAIALTGLIINGPPSMTNLILIWLPITISFYAFYLLGLMGFGDTILLSAIYFIFQNPITYIIFLIVLMVAQGIYSLIYIPIRLKQGWKITKNGFIKKIPAKDLKPWQVLADSKTIDSPTKEEYKRIKKTKKYVWVYDAIPLAPAVLVTYVSFLLSL